MRHTLGGPAFPSHGPGWTGMGLRDYFAAHALAAIIAKHERIAVSPDEVCEESLAHAAIVTASHATGAYMYADAMLRERDK